MTQMLTSADHLGNLVAKLEIESTQKRDFIIPARELYYRSESQAFEQVCDLGLPIAGERGSILTDLCHSQVGSKLGIPAVYYQRMQAEAPALLGENINGWLGKSDSKFLLRTLESDPESPRIARALLSDRYNLLDNYDVLLAALEAIKKMGVNVQITKAEVTGKRMYLHVGCPEIELEAKSFLREYMRNEGAGKGDGIYTGFVLTNSEVGLGSFEIRPRATIIKCMNGLITSDESFRRIHLGSKMDAGEIQWSERTQQKNYELVISQTQDAIKTYLSKEYLNGMIQKVAAAHEIKLDNPYDTVQHVCRELMIGSDHKKEILNYFLNDGDHRASGVFQAITRQAQYMNADLQFEVECRAGKLLPNIKEFDKPFSSN